MRVVDPGHIYRLDCLAATSGDRGFRNLGEIAFVKRIGDHYPGNEPPGRAGPTTQEVIRALIDRTKYVDAQIHSYRNGDVIDHLRSALRALEARAAEERGELRELADALYHNAGFIEDLPTCGICGHIACGRHE